MIQQSPQTEVSSTERPVDIIIQSWRDIPQSDLESQAPGKREEAKALTEKLTRDKTAHSRQNALEEITKKKMSPQSRLALRIVAALVGTITLSAGAQIITARLGPIGLPAALGVAGTLAFIDNRCITRAHTNYQRRTMAHKALTNQITAFQEAQPTNELGTAAHKAAIDVIKTVEGDPQVQSLPTNTVVGTLLNGTEFAVNVWIIAQLGLPGGPVLVGLVSLIPIGIQLAAAIADSEAGELPTEAASLHNEYQIYRWLWEKLSAEKQVDEYHGIQRLNVALRFLPHGDPSGECKNLSMALAKADIQHYSRQKQRFEMEGVKLIHQQQQQHKHDLKTLPERFQDPVGLTEEAKKLERQRWIQHETQILEQQLQDDLKQLRATHALKLKHCQEQIDEAKQQYKTAKAAWDETYATHMTHGRGLSNNIESNVISLPPAKV